MRPSTSQAFACPAVTILRTSSSISRAVSSLMFWRCVIDMAEEHFLLVVGIAQRPEPLAHAPLRHHARGPSSVACWMSDEAPVLRCSLP